jgi:D-alanyl-D-alanine dipeptidase
MRLFFHGLVLCVFAVSAMSQVKTPAPPPVKKPFAESLQTLVVTTSEWDAVQGTARLYERKNSKSQWNPVGDAFPIVVGRSGLAMDESLVNDVMRTSQLTVKPVVKHEGDGRSPAGLFPLTFAFGSKTSPATKLAYTDLKEFTECVDDVNSNYYNTVVDRLQVGNYDWKSSEKMLAVGEAYERGVFVAYNAFPPQKGNGSCIFLHIWKDANSGTSGCTAMKRSDIETLLARLDPAKNPYLVQFPLDVYASHQRSWKLPKLK